MKKINKFVEDIKGIHLRNIGVGSIPNSLHYTVIMGKHDTKPCVNFVRSMTQSIHSEVHAIEEYYKIRRKRQFSTNFLVIRLNKLLELKNSKPCKNCLDKIRRSGIPVNKIFYSNDVGNIVWEYLKACVTFHISWGFKKLIKPKPFDVRLNII